MDFGLALNLPGKLGIVKWTPYLTLHPDAMNRVVGDVRVSEPITSHGLQERELIVYLPPSYAHTTRHYPVLYMHDGQNLFDEARSYAGKWGVDETAERLAGRDLEAIIVGVPNGGVERINEYGPWFEPDVRLPGVEAGAGGKAHQYLRFLLETVKPLIDTSFRTLPDRAHTGTAGSSMGGLISLWLCLEAPAVFGFCGAFSSALWVGEERIFDYAREHIAPGLRVYLDCGRFEGVAGATHREYLEANRHMRDILKAQGYDLAWIEDRRGKHNEADWRRRFPAVYEWFLNPQQRPDRVPV